MKTLLLSTLCSVTALTPEFAYETTDAIALVVDGFAIPIQIITPHKKEGPFPVVYHVHGGGWNGDTTTAVPEASLPQDSRHLCDELGIIYVGLAYRGKKQGTFQEAIVDLKASIAWFESRADEFNADVSRVGFSGESAGTPLAAVLTQSRE